MWRSKHLPRAIRRLATGTLARHRRATISLLFATLLIPLMMIVGLSVDYSFYAEAEAQLNMAADTAALHAVRAASTATANGMTYQAAGLAAAQQWFAAQVTPLTGITITGGYEPLPSSDISITYTATNGSYTAAVSFAGKVATHFGGLFGIPSWNIAGTASATIANNFVEVDMLLDNSASMLLPSTAAGILALEQSEMCSTQAATSGIGESINGDYNYTWVYPGNYGYGTNTSTGKAYTPAPVTQVGNCDPGYDGAATECFYPGASLPATTAVTGKCPASNEGYGGYPAAPCAFACHGDPAGGTNDYYGLARSLGIQLRFDVIQSAAATVIQQLQAAQNQSGVPNQFSVGVYAFWAQPIDGNSNNLASFGEGLGFKSVYPGPGNGEAGTNLTLAETDTQAITTPYYSGTTYPTINHNASDTNFPAAMTMLGNIITASGSGGTSTTPRKNLFIVTDGMEDLPGSQGPINPANCTYIKSLGVQIYVLYTPYLPLPNMFYISGTSPTFKSIVEGTNGGTPPIITALQSCASSTADFYQAANDSDITAAMQAMLDSAINSPGRLTN